MASRSKVVVVLAILSLPAPLLGQVRQTREPATSEQAPATSERAPERQPEDTGVLILPISVSRPAAETTEPAQASPPAPTAAVTCADLAVCISEPCCRATESFCFRTWWEGGYLACGTPRESIFIFGGPFTRGSMGDTADIFNVTYDYDNWLIGLAYQRYHCSTKRFHWGWEIGGSGRFCDGESFELWGGPSVRHDGVTLFQLLTVKPSLTAGFSTITESMGQERRRERGRKGDATFLYYLGPEIAISNPRCPNVELFYRLHHRCGGGRTLGGLSEGYNANTLGLRFRF